MSDWTHPQKPVAGTWGALVVHAASMGVTVEKLPSVTYADGATGEVFFLMRKVEGEVLTYPMPRDCTAERKLGYGRMGHICQRMKIGFPKHWPVDF